MTKKYWYVGVITSSIHEAVIEASGAEEAENIMLERVESEYPDFEWEVYFCELREKERGE